MEIVATTLPPSCETSCGEIPASLVDFDLALTDLEEEGLIDTGPMVAYDNPPNSLLFVVGIRSKNEYAYLTEKGI